MGAMALALALTLAAVLLGPTAVRAAEPDVDRIIKDIDELYRSTSSYSEIEMHVVTPHWERTMAMNVWTEGMDKTFVRVTAPRKEMGMATLRVENEMWNYLPKTNKVIKVPPSMMMSSWMGSDFTNDDIVREFSLYEDYAYELVTPEEAEPGIVHIDCIPREDLPVVWAHVVIAVREADHLPVWQRYYDEKNELMRTMYFEDIRTFGTRTIPSAMELVPENKKGHRTVVRYIKLDFDAEIDGDIFSLRNLRASR